MQAVAVAVRMQLAAVHRQVDLVVVVRALTSQMV
jgi:hypothetical protein